MNVAATITQKPEGTTAYQAHRTAEAIEARELTGSQILCEALMREGVELLYGYPGGAIMPFYDALTSYPALHHVLVRHEQAAAHAADGYARATGDRGAARLRRADDGYLHQLSNHHGADPRRAHGVWRYRRRDLFQQHARRAQQF